MADPISLGTFYTGVQLFRSLLGGPKERPPGSTYRGIPGTGPPPLTIAPTPPPTIAPPIVSTPPIAPPVVAPPVVSTPPIAPPIVAPEPPLTPRIPGTGGPIGPGSVPIYNPPGAMQLPGRVQLPRDPRMVTPDRITSRAREIARREAQEYSRRRARRAAERIAAEQAARRATLGTIASRVFRVIGGGIGGIVTGVLWPSPIGPDRLPPTNNAPPPPPPPPMPVLPVPEVDDPQVRLPDDIQPRITNVPELPTPTIGAPDLSSVPLPSIPAPTSSSSSSPAPSSRTPTVPELGGLLLPFLSPFLSSGPSLRFSPGSPVPGPGAPNPFTPPTAAPIPEALTPTQPGGGSFGPTQPSSRNDRCRCPPKRKPKRKSCTNPIVSTRKRMKDGRLLKTVTREIKCQSSSASSRSPPARPLTTSSRVPRSSSSASLLWSRLV